MNSCKLFYGTGNKWICLPDWAYFFYELGRTIVSKCESDKRLIAGLTVPVRSYAAPLIALGIVENRSKVSVGSLNQDEHFEYLKSLPLGTVLEFIDGKRKKIAYHDGPDEVLGQPRIRIRIHGGNNSPIELISPKQSLLIKVAKQSKRLPINQKGKEIITNQSFIEALLKEVDPYEFALNSRTDCTIIGNRNRLEDEIKETDFAVLSKNKYLKGNLNDILRVKNFLNRNASYRTEIVSCIKKMGTSINYDKDSFIVIFDGSNAFLNWRENWSKSNWIVILDRTEPSFRDAVNVVNNHYLQKRTGKDLNKEFPHYPPGLEFLVYKEVLR